MLDRSHRSPWTRAALPAAFVLLALPVAAQEAATDAPLAGAFEVRLDPEVFAEGFAGDLLVALARRGEPRQRMHAWFGAPPMLRFEVDVEPGDGPLVLRREDAAAHYPVAWDDYAWESEPTDAREAEDDSTGPWRVQAVARRSRTGREPGLDPGDAFSAPVELRYRPDAEGRVVLEVDQVVPETTFEETDRVKLFELTSPSLSAFWGFDYTLRAGVLLPIDHDPEETYPVLYSVTGFGGTADSIRGWVSRAGADSVLSRCIVVVPDASNRWGHSVFCDSACIGPWGTALVEELIPALEAEYGGGDPAHRWVTGGSSGGWSSLWLQVVYPDTFAGCWSHVPDPIDFHDFQGIDLYTPLPDGSPRNMYRDEDGNPRPLARNGDQVLLTYEEFVRREHVLNPGGQIRSFEATFGRPGPDGEPQRVFDVETGEIDHAVARTWRPYDISARLLNDWTDLEPVLDGKIRVYAGEVDNFFLEGAVERFRGLAEEAGLLDHMVVEVVPGLGHSTHQPGYADMLATIAGRLAESEPTVPERPKAPWEED